MLKQEEIVVVEDTGVDINSRHMARIRVNMLVTIRYVPLYLQLPSSLGFIPTFPLPLIHSYPAQ